MYTKKVLIGEKIRYFADEYDLLYTYLQGGFNNFDNLYYKKEKKEVLFVPYKEGIITKKAFKKRKEFSINNRLYKKKQRIKLAGKSYLFVSSTSNSTKAEFLRY